MPPRNRSRPPASGALTPNPQPLMTTEPASAPSAPARKRGRELVDPVYLAGRVERQVRDDFQRQAIAERRSVAELLDAAVHEYLARRRPQAHE